MKLGMSFASLAARSAAVVSPSLLWLAGCSGYCEAGGAGGYGVGVTEPTQPACVDWYAYDDEWHRHHCDDPAYVWCNAPAGGTVSIAGGDAGASPMGAGDAGAAPTTTPEAGGPASLDSGAPPSMSSTSGADSGPASSGPTADAGGTTTDAGAGAIGNAGDAAPTNPCATSTACAVGTSCVAGSCQPCGGGVCICQRDDDCPASQICDHAAGTCAAPPPACTGLTTEAACAARADCSPIYGGMSCTNNVGSECHSGEANCTCATYSFAACVVRVP
jgi:hypothetical protein